MLEAKLREAPGKKKLNKKFCPLLFPPFLCKIMCDTIEDHLYYFIYFTLLLSKDKNVFGSYLALFLRKPTCFSIEKSSFMFLSSLMLCVSLIHCRMAEIITARAVLRRTRWNMSHTALELTQNHFF